MSDTQLIATVRQRLSTGQPPTIAQTVALLRIIDDLDRLYVRAAQMNDALYAAIASCGLHVVRVREAGRPLAWAYQWEGESPCGRFATPSAALAAGVHVGHTERAPTARYG